MIYPLNTVHVTHVLPDLNVILNALVVVLVKMEHVTVALMVGGETTVRRLAVLVYMEQIVQAVVAVSQELLMLLVKLKTSIYYLPTNLHFRNI